MARVLHIISGLKVGGAEAALLRLINSSRGGDYHHTVVTLSPGGGMRKRFEHSGVEVIELDFKRSFVLHFVRLILLIREMKPDIVQTWMYHADLLGGLAARFAGNPNVIWGIHSTFVGAGGSRMTVWVMRVCAALSGWVPKSIVCVAEASRQVHVTAGYDASRIRVLPNGIDLSEMNIGTEGSETLRTGFGLAPDHLVVGTLGRFNPVKDYETFVSAAALLAKQYPAVRFMMVGRDLESRNEILMRWINRAGLGDRFILLGERDDAPACLACMDIFCLSSRTEALPTVVAEAMSMCRPCVVTDVGDTAYLVGDTGVVVPKENPVLLAKGLGTLVGMSPPERLRLGQRARERIQAYFTMEKSRMRIEQLYEQVMNDKKAAY